MPLKILTGAPVYERAWPRTGQRPVLALRRRHHDRDPLRRVVRVALQVPGRLERLGVARRVGGAAAQEVLAGGSVPGEAPAAPGVRAQRRAELGRGERLAA